LSRSTKLRQGLGSVILTALLLAGCLTTGNELLRNDATLAQVKAGETTKEQVIALLGDPTYRRSTTISGYTYEWWSYNMTSSTINPLEYLLLVGFFFNGIGLPDEERAFHLSFNADGVVTNVHHQVTTFDMGTFFTPLEVSSRTKTGFGLPKQTAGATMYEDQMTAQSP
jgi:outer membrane protein assembly factor BamE (lipoprotein component of BamABCDE complex)